jgi:predicted phosphodiesterase
MTPSTAPPDLLQPDGPLLVFGGPYSNLEATRAVLAEALRRDLPPERIVCTGDVVAYCADPAETVALIRDSGIHVVMGNCEEAFAQSAADCGCGFEEGSACAALAVAWYRYADRVLDRDARAWMGQLPRRIDIALGGRRLAVVHGGTSEINKFVFASATEADLVREIDGTGCDGVVAGHCGLPFTRIVRRRLWHNAGVVGMPANDGTPRVWYSILRWDADAISIEHRPLDYDWRSASAKMRGAGLPAGYSEALATGLWPSCDILPLAERERRGQPLDAPTYRWRFTASTPPAAASG